MSRLLVVVGDALLDRDVDGTADRLCPDAPAPVLAEQYTVDRPGGAALAALLAADLGYQVVLVTGLADDPAGARVRELLTAAGVEVHAIPMSGATPEKIRLRADRQVLLRLDRGDGGTLRGDPPAAALAALRQAAAVLVSDYGRGVARQDAIRRALPAAGVAGAAPLVWDPHPAGPPAVPGARLVTPNERELRGLVDTGSEAEKSGGPAEHISSGPDRRSLPRFTALARGAAALREGWQAGAVAVTLGGDGALLCHAGPTPLVVPPGVRAQGDSCGAGDRFAAAATAALADGALVSEAVQEAVAQASGYVAAGGASAVRTGPRATAGQSDVDYGPGGDARAQRVPPAGHAPDEQPARAGQLAAPVGAEAAAALVAEVRARGGTVVASGGCFDLVHAGHVATLQAARRLGDCLVVCLNSDASVRTVKGSGRPVVPQADRARLLAALGCVDAVVVFDETTPLAVLDALRPDVWVKGGDYTDGFSDDAAGDSSALPEAELVRRWGGQTVVVPYLAGRSTSKVIAAARRADRRGGGKPPDDNDDRRQDKGHAS